MQGIRLGAFGWATHDPKSANANRVAKKRPCVVVMQNGANFIVVFGRSEPHAGQKRETVSDQSELGRRLGLTVPTHFQGEIALCPADFEGHGFFVTGPEDGSHPDALDDHDLWLRLRTLASRR